jgi:hypothetical protein
VIRVLYILERPSRINDRDQDVFELIADVDLANDTVRLLGGKVKRGGTRLEPYALSPAELYSEPELGDYRTDAIAEAMQSPRACEQCGRAEADAPATLCGDCLPVHGEQGACFAQATAGALVLALQRLAEEPVLRDELQPLIHKAQALYNDAAARAEIETKSEAAQ